MKVALVDGTFNLVDHCVRLGKRERGRGRLACTACGPVKTNTEKIKGMSLWFGGFFEMSAAKGNRRLPQSIVRIKNSLSLLFSSLLWKWSKMVRDWERVAFILFILLDRLRSF